MNITWEKLSPDDANGEILKYEVCYKASVNSTDIDCDSSESVNNSDTTDVVLDGLNEATTYNVAVRAATSQGFGGLGNIMTRKTLEASKYCPLVYLPCSWETVTRLAEYRDTDSKVLLKFSTLSSAVCKSRKARPAQIANFVPLFVF